MTRQQGIWLLGVVLTLALFGGSVARESAQGRTPNPRGDAPVPQPSTPLATPGNRPVVGSVASVGELIVTTPWACETTADPFDSPAWLVNAICARHPEP